MKKIAKALKGADDIYLTARSIAVVRVRSKKNNLGGYNYVKDTNYIPRSKDSEAIARAIYGPIKTGGKK